MSACQHVLRPRFWPLAANSELFCERCGKTQKAINAERAASALSEQPQRISDAEAALDEIVQIAQAAGDYGSRCQLQDTPAGSNTRTAAEAASAARVAEYQARVDAWMVQTFSPEVRADRVERAMRFLEEATELCQSIGLTPEKAHTVVDYVFGRPVGEPWQEVGGTMVTLAALCQTVGQDMAECGERELARIDTPVMRQKIAAKQVSKRLFGMVGDSVEAQADTLARAKASPDA